ncbi:MAG: serine/threonine protein kinase, partial [Pseudomonadota bacterium]
EASRETRALSAVLVVKDGYSPQEFYFAGGKQSPSSDLYALGATFYHLITGSAPPNSQTRMAEFAGNNPDPCVPLAGRFDEYEPEFLAAIDQAMRILPKDRLQTARQWSAMIAAQKTQPAPTPIKPKTDDKLEKTLTRLVTETNEYVRNSEPREGKQKSGEPVISQPRVSAPKWVEEFNAETTAFQTRKPARVAAKRTDPSKPKATKQIPDIVPEPIQERSRFRSFISDRIFKRGTD